MIILSTFSRLAEEVSNALDSDGAQELWMNSYHLFGGLKLSKFMCELC